MEFFIFFLSLHTSYKCGGLQTELQSAQNQGPASRVQDTNLQSHVSFRRTPIPFMGVQQDSEIKTKHSPACGSFMVVDVKQFC